jgi:hypothetical protein
MLNFGGRLTASISALSFARTTLKKRTFESAAHDAGPGPAGAYERRAWSRRKRAIGDFMAIKARSSG